jgi:hypothetical protein
MGRVTKSTSNHTYQVQIPSTNQQRLVHQSQTRQYFRRENDQTPSLDNPTVASFIYPTFRPKAVQSNQLARNLPEVELHPPEIELPEPEQIDGQIAEVENNNLDEEEEIEHEQEAENERANNNQPTEDKPVDEPVEEPAKETNARRSKRIATKNEPFVLPKHREN